MRIIALRQTFRHMGSHSGYDLLFKSIDSTVGQKGGLSSVFRFRNSIQNVILELPAIMIKSSLPYYSGDSLSAELRLILKLKTPFDILHVAYLEDCYRLLAKIKLKKLKRVGTVHQPFAWWNNKAGLDLLSSLDAIIVLSEKDKIEFDSLFSGKVYFIPHGIDDKFFKPATNYKYDAENPVLLCVGGWLRNWSLLEKVFRLIKKTIPGITLRLVVPSRFEQNKEFSNLATADGVVWLKNISDDELLKVYQSSDLFILPLIRATANNALLEAMACGLPIVLSATDGASGYISDKFATQVSGDELDSFYDSILHILTNHKIMNEQRIAARRHAESLSWENVSKRYLELYKELKH